MANSFLDKTGLTYLWGKIVALVNRKQDTLTFDSTPTDNSTNPVTSGGVKAYVDANAGGDSPFESGTGNGSAVLKNADNMALYVYSTAEGYGTHAFGVESHTEGEDTYALGYQAHSEGYRTVARAYAHSEGLGTTFKLNITAAASSFSPIYTCQSIPDHLKAGMHILKPDTTILIPITAVDRTNKQITCASSLDTTGKLTVYSSSAYGNGSHVEGSGSAAFGTAAHAEGSSTGAKGAYSHAEGRSTEANGSDSHAEGVGTIANSEHQHVEGAYNVEDTGGTGTYVHITGIGTNKNDRKNGFTVDWQGNGVFYGNVTANGQVLASQAYVDNGDKAIELQEVDAGSDGNQNPDYDVFNGYYNGPALIDYNTSRLVIASDVLMENRRYVLRYEDSNGDGAIIPLTKVQNMNGGQHGYYYRLTFGNGDRVYVDFNNYLIPEDRYPSGE